MLDIKKYSQIQETDRRGPFFVPQNALNVAQSSQWEAEWKTTLLKFVCTQDKPNCGHASPQDLT